MLKPILDRAGNPLSVGDLVWSCWRNRVDGHMSLQQFRIKSLYKNRYLNLVTVNDSSVVVAGGLALYYQHSGDCNFGKTCTNCHGHGIMSFRHSFQDMYTDEIVYLYVGCLHCKGWGTIR